MQETRVQSLGWEDPLEKEMATHSSVLAWKIPWTEERDRLQFMGSQRVGYDWATSLRFSFIRTLYRCLENMLQSPFSLFLTLALVLSPSSTDKFVSVTKLCGKITTLEFISTITCPISVTWFCRFPLLLLCVQFESGRKDSRWWWSRLRKEKEKLPHRQTDNKQASACIPSTYSIYWV